MKKRNLNMTSSKKEFKLKELEELYSSESIEYINHQMDEFYDEKLELMVVELHNNEKILCFCDIAEVNVLYLPIHLIEHVNERGSLSYLFYSYHNLADDCSELILLEAPKVMFAPSKTVTHNFFEYWDSICKRYSKDIENLENENFLEIEPLTKIAS